MNAKIWKHENWEEFRDSSDQSYQCVYLSAAFGRINSYFRPLSSKIEDNGQLESQSSYYLLEEYFLYKLYAVSILNIPMSDWFFSVFDNGHFLGFQNVW